MKFNIPSRAALLPIAVALTTFGLTGCSSGRSPVSPSIQGNGSPAALGGGSAQAQAVPDLPGAAFEVKLMTYMLDYHAMAIEAGRQCTAKAVHIELVGVCGDMITLGKAQTEDLASLLQGWYGETHDPVVLDQAELARLDLMTGAEFEQAVMATMIRQDRMAIIEERKAPGRAVHQELLDLAKDAETAQVRDMSTLETAMCDFYGNCR